jgi:hypothetical protein
MKTADAIAIDAHGHFYPGFDARAFVDSAHAHLAGAAARRGHEAAAGVVFVLGTSAGPPDGFGRLKAAVEAGALAPTAWCTRPTAEPVSLCLERPRGGRLVVVAGRQVVSGDDLEVLALGTQHQFAAGKATETLICRVARAGGLPVVPWGVGKWLGRRGEQVRELLENAAALPPFFVGDNANRPALWPRSAHFQAAAVRGIKNLPGTDPLPFPRDARRVGRFGTILRGGLDPERPAQHLRHRLLEPSTTLRPFGRGASALRFVRHQLRLQLRSRLQS